MNDLEFKLNDGAVNFTLSEGVDFTLNDGELNFKLNAENPEPVVVSGGFDYTLNFGFQ